MIKSGGMGLTGGIADVGSLYDALVGIHQGLADSSILDKYDEVRRKIWHEVINPISTENLRRLFTQDPETAAEKDPFFKMVKQAEQDEGLSQKMKHVSGLTKSVCGPITLTAPRASWDCDMTCPSITIRRRRSI